MVTRERPPASPLNRWREHDYLQAIKTVIPRNLSAINRDVY